MADTAQAAVIEEWKASFAAVSEGRISYAEHRAWVLAQHEPTQRDMFKQLWADTEETMAMFERFGDESTEQD